MDRKTRVARSRRANKTEVLEDATISTSNSGPDVEIDVELSERETPEISVESWPVSRSFKRRR